MTARSGWCTLCAEHRGQPDKDGLQRSIGGPYERRVLDEVDDAFCVPSLGPLGHAHVLVCPVRHVQALTALTDWEIGAVDDLAGRVRSRMREIYGSNVIAFEHGGCFSDRPLTACIEHAHLHLVALPESTEVELPQGHRWENCGTSLKDVKSVAKGSAEYLMVSSAEGKAFVATDGPFQSQLMRRVIAEALGGDQSWNWRIHPRPLEVAQMITRLKGQSQI